MSYIKVLFMLLMTVALVVNAEFGGLYEDKNMRITFTKTLCEDHLQSKTAKMVGHATGDAICTKPIHCYDPQIGLKKTHLPLNSHDGLICKIAFRPEGRIPYICKAGQCVEAPEFQDQLGFVLKSSK